MLKRIVMRIPLLRRILINSAQISRLSDELEALAERHAHTTAEFDSLSARHAQTTTALDNLTTQTETKLAALSESQSHTATEFIARLDSLNQAAAQQSAMTESLSQLIHNNEQWLKLVSDNLSSNEQWLKLVAETQQTMQGTTTQLANKQAEFDAVYKVLDELEIFSQPSYERRSFSQAGEDMILFFILNELGLSFSKITYLDLGANHAKLSSNTYFFYKNNAKGVLVEANPMLIPELKLLRGQDVILNKCISTHSGEFIDFYVLSGDGLSTTSKESAENFISQNPSLRIERTVSVETITINEVMEKYFAPSPDILNIDIEGLEMEILESMDFEKYRPLAIIVEMIPYTSPFSVSARNQEIMSFMNKKDYHEYAYTGVNSIFLDKRKLKQMGRYNIV